MRFELDVLPIKSTSEVFQKRTVKYRAVNGNHSPAEKGNLEIPTSQSHTAQNSHWATPNFLGIVDGTYASKRCHDPVASSQLKGFFRNTIDHAKIKKKVIEVWDLRNISKFMLVVYQYITSLGLHITRGDHCSASSAFSQSISS